MTVNVALIHGYLDSPRIWDQVVSNVSSIYPDGPEINFIYSTYEKITGDINNKSDVILDGFRVQLESRIFHERSSESDPLFLVGHSMGGAVAELIAEVGNIAVDGMLSLTAVPLEGFPLPPAVMAQFEHAARVRDRARSRESRLRLAKHLNRASLESMLDAAAEIDPELAIQQLIAWTGGHPVGRQPSRIECPVLSITTDDTFFSRQMIEVRSERFARGSTRHIGNAGHWVHAEQPREVAQILANFVRENSE